jgi:quercetin dioxygenase-like cupin family protein
MDRKSPANSVVIVVVTFLIGIFCGRHSVGRPRPNKQRIIPGSIHRLADTPIRNTSHKDANNRPITKQQFLEPFDVPNVAGFSVTTLLPGQQVQAHVHQSMHEFFYILEGKGTFTIDGKQTIVETGTMVHVTPHEVHQIDAPDDGSLKMLMAGITVDDR